MTIYRYLPVVTEHMSNVNETHDVSQRRYVIPHKLPQHIELSAILDIVEAASMM